MQGTAALDPRGPIVRELDHMRQGWKIAQLHIFVARNVVCSSHGRKHLRLFDGVDAQVGFQVEIQVQHVFGISGLFSHDLENHLLDGIIGIGRRHERCRGQERAPRTQSA